MIISNHNFNFAITEDGKLYSWGRNHHGQLGLGHRIDQNSPQSVVFFSDQYVDEFGAGFNCTFAIVNGRLYSWGLNNHGQLGLGHNIDQNQPQLVDFFRDKVVVNIICGTFHTFAITEDNAIYSWGSNYHGQLGLGNNIHQSCPQLVDFFCDKNVRKIICGNCHTYAIVDNGQLYSWGSNKYNKLCLGNNINQHLPQLVDFFCDKIVKQIINSDNHTFAIIQDGSVYSWGRNRYGELGLGNNIDRNLPQLVDFFHDKIIYKIICYNYLTFAIISDGSLYSWGKNEYGQLGLGNNDDQNSPQLVDFFQNMIVQDIVSCYDCTFANVNGDLYSWGNNEYGQLGLGHNNDENSPQLVDFFRDKNISNIIYGTNYIFVVIDDGSIYSWGENYFGYLGLGNNDHQNLPQLMDFFQDNKIRQTRKICRVKSANSTRNI